MNIYSFRKLFFMGSTVFLKLPVKVYIPDKRDCETNMEKGCVGTEGCSPLGRAPAASAAAGQQGWWRTAEGSQGGSWARSVAIICSWRHWKCRFSAVALWFPIWRERASGSDRWVPVNNSAVVCVAIWLFHWLARSYLPCHNGSLRGFEFTFSKSCLYSVALIQTDFTSQCMFRY